MCDSSREAVLIIKCMLEFIWGSLRQSVIRLLHAIVLLVQRAFVIWHH